MVTSICLCASHVCLEGSGDGRDAETDRGKDTEHQDQVKTNLCSLPTLKSIQPLTTFFFLLFSSRVFCPMFPLSNANLCFHTKGERWPLSTACTNLYAPLSHCKGSALNSWFSTRTSSFQPASPSPLVTEAKGIQHGLQGAMQHGSARLGACLKTRVLHLDCTHISVSMPSPRAKRHSR